MRCPLLPCAWLAALALGAGSASAAPRAFAYNHESRALPAGSVELEPSTTFRVGRARYFARVDGRVELEQGLTSALQLGLALNLTSQSRDVVGTLGGIDRVSESDLAGGSIELHYQLSDAAADVLGSALYLQSTLGARGTWFEAKLVGDRAVGRWLLAANLTGEYALRSVRNTEGSELTTALTLEPALAAAYAIAEGVRLGLELRAPLGLTGDERSSALFAGPVASWAQGKFWGVCGVQPQLVALSGASPDSQLALEQRERVELRLLLGVSL
jgi:hypothetical protein